MSKWEKREVREGDFRQTDGTALTESLTQKGSESPALLHSFKNSLYIYPGEMIIQFLLEHFQWEETD